MPIPVILDSNFFVPPPVDEFHPPNDTQTYPIAVEDTNFVCVNFRIEESFEELFQGSY